MGDQGSEGSRASSKLPQASRKGVQDNGLEAGTGSAPAESMLCSLGNRRNRPDWALGEKIQGARGWKIL